MVHAAPIRIVPPLPGFIIGYPGELITESFVYEGAPVIEHSLTLAGENIAKSEKFKFRRELQSDNTTKVFLEIPEPQEDDSGLLNIALTGVNSTDGTESYIIIIRKWLFSTHYLLLVATFVVRQIMCAYTGRLRLPQPLYYQMPMLSCNYCINVYSIMRLYM